MMDSSFSWVTEQGHLVEARPLEETDSVYLIQLFESLSEESRYNRFQRPLAHPSVQMVRRGAEQLARVEPGQGRAWIAFAEVDGMRVPVAVGRYGRLNETEAEPALTVMDGLQGQGIGTVLFARLVAAAAADQFHQFIATVRPSNRAVMRLVQKTGLPYTQTIDEGQTVLTITLPTVAEPIN